MVGAARGMHSAFGVKNDCFSMSEKKCFWPPCITRGGFEGSSLHYSEESDLQWYWVGDKSVVDDNLIPFSSDKIQAKEKSARILSAAIARTILLLAGVRMPRDDFHLGVDYVRLR